MSKAPGKKPRHSLRRDLALLVAALVVPLLALQAWWSYHDYESARESAERDALAFADASALGVTQFFSQAEDLLTATAEQFGAAAATPEACPLYVGTMVGLFPFLENALAVDREGSILCSAFNAPGNASAAEWGWFRAVREDPVFLVGRPVEAEFIGNGWILPLIAPITNAEGAFEGALVGTVPLNDLSRLFGEVSHPEDHLITVATAERIIVARSSDAEEHVGQPLPPLSGSDRSVGPGRWVATGPDRNGIDRTWGQVEVSPGWIVYVGVPDAEVLGPALTEALGHVAVTLLVVLLGVLLAGRSYAGIARALKELVGRAADMQAGELMPLPEGTPAEVTELVEQFNETLRSREAAQASEKRARDRFQSIFDNAVFGLSVSTSEGRFLQVNPALVAILGYDSQAALIEAGLEALSPHPGQPGRLFQESLLSGEVEAREVEWLRADGIPVTVRVGGKTIEGPGGEPVFQMIVQDITAERRTQNELRQTQKMEAIGQLAGGVAHDFNNLLTVIGGNVELLEDDIATDNPLRDDLRQIKKATKRAASVTRRLLAFSHPQLRGAQVDDMNEVLPDFGRLLVPLIGEDVELEMELGEGPFPISIDPGELEHIVLNLVINSRDALPRGGRIVLATCGATAPDDLGFSDAGDGVTLTVSDDGVGMDESTTPRIFEPFYTTKPMGQGTGLGLSTVYGIVKRAGGAVAAQSEPGVGTTISLWFPLCEPATSEGADADKDASHALSDMGARGTETVLVVEDDEQVVRFVQKALTEAGWSVLTASHGDEALTLMRRHGGEVDLVLTDVVMPGIGGPELAERLALTAPQTPVVFMSGYVDDSLLSESLDRHPEHLLRKPFSARQLRQRIRETLDRNPASSGSR